MAKNLGGGVANTSRGAGGSGWAETHVLELRGGGRLFAKIARGRAKNDMFRGEFLGLNAMSETETIGVPRAFHYDDLYAGPPGGTGSWILMDYVDMSSRVDQGELGESLARMHLATPVVPEARGGGNDDDDEDDNDDDKGSGGLFGFSCDNTIGATPQPNDWTRDWVTFYREKRLWHQLQLAGDATLLKLGERALERLDEIFNPVDVRPSILHGDLWSGNIAASAKGRAFIFDPAAYYGHHEADFGMSWCANFTGKFWDAYFDVIPKEPAGFEERKRMYMLYHYLNHLNLFGSSYYYSCEDILKRFN